MYSLRFSKSDVKVTFTRSRDAGGQSHIVRDWSLITGRGGLQNGKIAGPKLFTPPPQDRVKLLAPPL